MLNFKIFIFFYTNIKLHAVYATSYFLATFKYIRIYLVYVKLIFSKELIKSPTEIIRKITRTKKNVF